MASYNKIVLVGRLTRDPELRYTGGGLAVTKFAVAVDRRFKNQQGERVTDFFDCSAFRQTAEFVSNYVTKGRLVLVEGSIEFNEATGQDGQKRRYTNVIADNVQTLDTQREGGEGGAPTSGGNSGEARSGGNRAPQGGGDGGYFPDEDAAPAQRAQNAAPAARAAAPRAAPPAASGAAASGAAASGGASAGAASSGAAAAPRRAAEPAYPEDDFDDSDPFADQ